MDWNEWDARNKEDSRYAALIRRQRAASKQARESKVLTATHQSSGAHAQDYRMHMLLSALMLIAALVIANLR